MKRGSVLVAGAVALVCGAFIVGTSVRAAKPPEAVKPDSKPATVGQKIGAFNMPKVMRDNKRAKTGLDRLNTKRQRLSANLTGLRAMYAELQAAQSKADGARKEEIAEDMRAIARRIEDTEREVNKIIDDRATLIIAELYDDLHAVATEVARANNLAVLFAYPDAVTAEEKESTFVKEMKLKPPAAQPFYVDASADYSDEIIRRLNEKYADEK